MVWAGGSGLLGGDLGGELKPDPLRAALEPGRITLCRPAISDSPERLVSVDPRRVALRTGGEPGELGAELLRGFVSLDPGLEGTDSLDALPE